MKHASQERFLTAAKPRHARLFELIRQENLTAKLLVKPDRSPHPVLSDHLRSLACKSLRKSH